MGAIDAMHDGCLWCPLTTFSGYSGHENDVEPKVRVKYGLDTFYGPSREFLLHNLIWGVYILKAKSNFTLLLYIPFLGIG